MADEHFHWADYLVFAAFLVTTALIGVFFGYRDRKKMTSKNFLTGGGNMHWSIVALSMQASFLSAIFIVSIPIEVYAWGTMYYYLVFSYFVALPFAGYFILPMYYKLNVTSAYEYLEIRFNKVVRTACAVTFVLHTLLYMAVVLYTPALALAQVTGLSVWLSILLCGLVCTFYTFVGGMKATIWNDFFQMFVIALTLIFMIVYGAVRVGGVSKVWQINYDGGRIQFNDFRVNPTIRTTFWTQTVGGIFVNLTLYAANQTTIQKYISVKTLSDAKKSVWMAACTNAFFLTLVCIIGLVVYAYYATCDPLSDGRIEKYDQLIPMFVMDIVGHLHGLPGLFIAATFSAALSSISGSLNALSAVTMTDFINPVYKKFKDSTGLDERTRAILSRVLTLTYGLLITALGFAAQFFGEVLFQVAFSIFGFVGGPLTCVVLLGVFFPFVSSIGVLSGLVSSLIVTSWIAIGAIIMNVDIPKLPMRVDGCDPKNSTFDTFTANSDDVLAIYKVSFMYYGWIALIVSFVMAIIVSILFGRVKTIDPRLVINWFEDCCCGCLPVNIKTCLSCGVDFVEQQEIISGVTPADVDIFFDNLAFDNNNEKSMVVDVSKMNGYQDENSEDLVKDVNYCNGLTLTEATNLDKETYELEHMAPTNGPPDYDSCKPTDDVMKNDGTDGNNDIRCRNVSDANTYVKQENENHYITEF